MQTLLIATSNKNKIKEIKDILSDFPFKLLTLKDINFRDKASETGKSFMENAILKAKFVGEKTKMLTLAEDSGLEVDVLGGRPGICSARYCKGTDLDRINKLLKELKGISKEKRTARFHTVVALFNPQTRKTVTFEGVSNGYITDKSIGKNGFGYDPVFFNFDLNKTNAQVSFKEKNRVSHRVRALLKTKEELKKLSL